MTNRRSWFYLVVCLVFATCLMAQVQSQVIQGEQLETFLKEAKIVKAQAIGKGVTLPQKLTLELNGTTLFGAFKSIDQSKPVMTFSDGSSELAFQDSWKTEVAAYEVDKIIGLGMVPATVERTVAGQKGSEQFWVDSIMSEGDRVKKKIQPPSQEKWNQISQKMKLFDNLIYNTDRHINNLLITKDWEIILIDHSRAFRIFTQLKDPKSLTRFSKSLLEGLQRLNKQDLTEKIGSYITPGQIDALLKRRDLVLDLAKKVVAEQGEAKALYP